MVVSPQLVERVSRLDLVVSLQAMLHRVASIAACEGADVRRDRQLTLSGSRAPAGQALAPHLRLDSAAKLG